jgi:hypothetical protein
MDFAACSVENVSMFKSPFSVNDYSVEREDAGKNLSSRADVPWEPREAFRLNSRPTLRRP